MADKTAGDKRLAPKLRATKDGSISFRKIENGWIIRESGENSKGDWYEKETYTDKEPEIEIST